MNKKIDKLNFLRFQVHRFKLVVPVVLVILVVLSFAAGAAKAAQQSLRVSPVIINVALSPDKTYDHEITIENLTNAPMPLKASFNDFITSGEEGGYVFENTRTNPLLSWTKLNETEFILNPKEQKKLQLTIKTPKSISLGGYYGVLFFEPVVQNAVPNATRVSSKIGILMLANVGVPDPNSEKAEILTFSTDLLSQDGNVPLLLRVKNISLNFFTAKPILTLKPLIYNVIPDLIGDPVNGEKELSFEDKIIFPGQVRRWTEESAIQGLSPNIYTAHMAVSTGDGQYVVMEKYFVVFPIMKALLIIGVLILVMFLIVRRKQLRQAVKELIK